VGEHLAKLLKSRITYHHAVELRDATGVIEPLAKPGNFEWWLPPWLRRASIFH